ncbi:cell division inhibitor SepF [Kineococcus xinjiangensis]|uniref:Cell division protein SepF n=1 Tax=Kineococcus xinjiangensis TaxID=512762 RepID=A0A2S6ILY3_9ACTN|nr:cell division protein SepF [Kineococcus xinjiangensis]PPK95229.1 cell division inhibitor SepF [Kineococcus xinjiangensis]
MAGALRKTMVYLGLAEDDRYDAEELVEDEPQRKTALPEHRSAPEPRGSHEFRSVPEHRTVAELRPESGPSQVTPIRRQVAQVVPQSSAPELHRITTIHPRTYNEAKTIGESFRQGVPVIMNLTDMDDSDAKRLVDFSAGLVFGLHGSIERVTSKVFLLSPQNVEVSAHEEERPQERTFFNQS